MGTYDRRRVKSIRDRVIERSVPEDRGYATKCFIWKGEQDRYGYGRIKRDGKYVPAHWAIIGDPPDGLEVDHLCKQRDCVRPSHLEYVTRQENLRRRDSAG